MPPEEVAAKYNTSIDLTTPAKSQGLTSAEAAKRLVEYGPNALTPPKKRNPFLRYLDFLMGLFNLLLIGAGILTVSWKREKWGSRLWIGSRRADGVVLGDLQYIVYAVDPANNFQNVYTGWLWLHGRA